MRSTARPEFDDIVDGKNHLVERGLVDASRVGITGGSYGGYATAWSATDLSALRGRGDVRGYCQPAIQIRQEKRPRWRLSASETAVSGFMKIRLFLNRFVQPIQPPGCWTQSIK